MLSGLEIERQLNKGNIVISPYNRKQLNPNSYNLTLHNELLVYKDKCLDMAKDNKTEKLNIPSSGIMLDPDTLYLGRTNEFTATDKFVPMLSGRSSTGRLGIDVHVTAGFGDVGFQGYWTLEIRVVHPIKIYPNVELCQIYYYPITGEYEPYSSGKYQKNKGIQASKMYEEFDNN